MKSTYLILRETPCGTPMLTVAEITLCVLIFLSAPYSITVPKNPVLTMTVQQTKEISEGSFMIERTLYHSRHAAYLTEPLTLVWSSS